MIEILFLLLVGHALADYPLQGDFLARGKNHVQPIDGVPWRYCLAAHSLIHGFFVYLVTGMTTLGIAETIAHWFIDYGKNEGFYGFKADQNLHIVCKLIWFLIFMITQGGSL